MRNHVPPRVLIATVLALSLPSAASADGSSCQESSALEGVRPAAELAGSGAGAHGQLLVRLRQSAPPFGLPLERVAKEIHAIWAPHLDLVVTTGAETCPVCADEVRVEIGDDPSPTAEALAWFRFKNGVPTRDIAVSLSNTLALLRESSWEGRRIRDLSPFLVKDLLARAVGRAVAHEIGHYVLRSTLHERTGLMRAGLSGEDAVQPRGNRFRLTMPDRPWSGDARRLSPQASCSLPSVHPGE